MRWHQHLFWRIFTTVWLVSMLGILVSLALYLMLSDPEDRRDAQIDRATYVAERVVNAYEKYEKPNLNRGHHPPIWIYDSQGLQIFGSSRPPPKDSIRLQVSSDTGAKYQVYLRLILESLALDRLVGFMLSVQAVWVLAISLFSSLLLAWLIVRPINALRRHVRVLYDDQNLSHRAEGRLSQRTDELGELAREFNQMADYVERTLGDQETLLRDVSHELRAPLARLRAASGLAEQRWGEDQKVLQRIAKECDQLERLITELLALSREGAASRGERIELSPMLSSLVEDARLIGPDHHIGLQIRLPAGLLTYQEPLSRILANLLGNAINHTPADTRIEVSVRLDSAQLRLRVVDNGPGVPAELLNDLGHPFKRSEHSNGYGLGLSICRKTAERAGGEIRFMNAETGGFIAELVLPLQS